jgi:hypothetical protein
MTKLVRKELEELAELAVSQWRTLATNIPVQMTKCGLCAISIQCFGSI